MSATWDRLGSPAVRASRVFRVSAGKTREVDLAVRAEADDIDAHQSAGSECKVQAKIVGTY